MADFKEAYDKCMAIEGFYSNVQGDSGGETWKGIARNFWPRWYGWAIIDQIKRTFERSEWNKAIKDHADVEIQVQVFYKDFFWNRVQGDKIPSQPIADELFEQAVNVGVHRAVEWLQEALNTLLPHLSNISTDGILGPNTLERLKLYIERSDGDDIHALLGVMNIYQGWHYVTLASNKDTGHKYRKFLKGWVNKRVEV